MLSLSRVQLFVTPWTAACQASLSFVIFQSLLKVMSIESVMPSNHVIPFSSCPRSFSASGAFPMSWLYKNNELLCCNEGNNIVSQLYVNKKEKLKKRSYILLC